MWVVLSFLSAFFAGLTSIFAKCGIKNIDSNLATAIRTVVVVIFSWVMVFITGVSSEIYFITGEMLLYLILSGISTGASWLCYFKALQIGDINKITPIDKSSTLLTMLIAIVFLGESVSFVIMIAMILIGLGTFMMIQKKETDSNNIHSNTSYFYGFASAFFASLTSILGKIGMQEMSSTLGTAIRTVVVLIMAWMVVFITKKPDISWTIDKKSWLFLVVSGIATGISWLCYYAALQTGPASVVVPIDKLSIVVTIVFSYLVFGEKLDKKSMLGLFFIVFGTLLLLT